MVVPRVPVRNGTYVVPKVRVRPHHVERTLLGITSLSDLHVPPSEVVDVELEQSRLRPCVSAVVAENTPGGPVQSSDGSHSSGKRVTFAKPSTSPSLGVHRSVGCRRELQQRCPLSRKGVRVKKLIQIMCGYSSRLAHKTTSIHCLFLFPLAESVWTALSRVVPCLISRLTPATTDVSVVSLSWLQTHPTCCETYLSNLSRWRPSPFAQRTVCQ